ncbi:hypothetical protein N7532_006615 [Penicillium argentinense]|uniref:Uncharacterized protein n=1 Tax=Penicillium argentinense TaxID=1131581 RepID=A0A9W9KAZ1_9EURO|nr:uncharacterized protein N7532_006615 [Penicillium argentinense]KAJ5099614.1 hypothetical protein N7532_006615 [Penicillium argentinense]
MDPDAQAPRWDGSRMSSSSFPRHGWSRLSPPYAPPAGDVGPSHYASWRPFNAAADEPDPESLLHTTSLRQMNQDLRHLSRNNHSNPRTDSKRPSTQPSQPVLVRAYSGNADDTAVKPSTMSPRRLFPFTTSKSSAASRPSGPPLPADKEFSIESILQAIEPDIRGTLDSIAEICGRSKLSLANEYGSHIAPLGEIRAPPGGLGPVEEASSTDERRADEGVAIFDGEAGLMDPGREIHLFSFYRYLERLRQAASVREHDGTTGLGLSIQADISRSATQLDAVPVGDLPVPQPTREFFSKSQSGRDLLAKNGTSDHEDGKFRSIATSLEVHLDAQADGPESSTEPLSSASSLPNPHPSRSAPKASWYAPEAVRSVLGWLRWTACLAEPESQPALQSAESRLRAMLERTTDDSAI